RDSGVPARPPRCRAYDLCMRKLGARTAVLATVFALATAAACAPEEDSGSDGGSGGSGDTAELSECTPEDLDLYEDGTLTVGTDAPAYDPWFRNDDPSNGKGYESAVAY